ncbi:multicopper oxidase family protein [Bacillus sp. SCS-153A]|uniref:multicopper oxidase family protein n=1 Tax=Rossellomorea sedimentorum TaxID=3115294 RepID=UPI0039059FFD
MEWEKRLKMPNGKKAPYQKINNARYYKLTAGPVKHHILKDVAIEGLGFNGEIPGPLLVFEQGETIMIEFVNKMDKPSALHVHGLSKPESQDGMPEIEPSTPVIHPGESYVYKFQAWQAGTFFYHASDPAQIVQGLLGPLVILPRETNKLDVNMPYRDYVLVLQQWDLPQNEIGKVTPGTYKPKQFDTNPNFFTINGKAFPETEALYTKYGRKIRMRFINKSSASHSMHVHGHDFQVTTVNGFPRYNMYDDTINVASGQRIEIDCLSNNPGTFPINGTKTFHQTNNGSAPGGMITKLVYKT